jgi:hypothetical protein
MRMVHTAGRKLAAGLALAVALAAVVLAAPVSEDAKNKPVSPADKVRKDLDQTITIEIVEQPLTMAISQLREQTKINFVLDRFTIQQMGIDPEQPIVNLKLKDVKVRTVLKSMLSGHNLSYAIIGETVLVSTDEVAMYRQMRQRVNVDLDKVEFASALKQLARETATNLPLDNRVAKEAKGEVSLQMEDVPLETAVRLMTEMVGLKAVRLGNVLFVTSEANANKLRADPDLQNPQIVGPGGVMMPGMMPGMPGMPGGPGGPPIAVPAPPPPPPAVEKTTEGDKTEKPMEKPDKDKTEKSEKSEKPDKGDKP